ncbi:pentapeptide repeat-containing protein [Gimesia maris]|uniref:pentapeptide repeat-containing protein n=1 Tax=Gimesia maris TaxID=122 RepID=UPI003A8E81D9
MANPDHVKIVKLGAARLAEWQEENPNVLLDLSDCDLEEIDLSGANLHLANLENARLSRVNLSGAVLNMVNFSSATLRNSSAQGIVFYQSDLSNAKLSNINLRSADFRFANLKKTYLCDSDLFSAVFDYGTLTETKIEKCFMKHTSLLDIKVNSETQFKNIETLDHCKIDRYTIASLGKDRGGLSDGNLMVMNINDDVARLRSEFSGVWGAFHLIAIFAFCAPYLWFSIQLRVEASFSDYSPEYSITLLKALSRYIWNGGIGWREGWDLSIVSFGTFIAFLSYNTLRISLLYKTKKLETQQEVSGVPAIFSFANSPGWEKTYLFSKLGLAIYLICVILNIYHFLQMRIPV